MNPEPTGRLISTPDGRTIEIARTFRAPIDHVWASLTESERTGRWIGTWTGHPGTGKTVDFIMSAEGVTEPSPVKITECEPPNLLALDMASPGGIWRVRFDLTEHDGTTNVRFRQFLGDSDDPSEIGPGWEYYFDRLVAAESGAEMPDWNDYYPGQSAHYNDPPTDSQ